MYGLHLLLDKYPEVRIFTSFSPNILSWNSNNSTLNTLWATPDLEWLIHCSKKGILE